MGRGTRGRRSMAPDDHRGRKRRNGQLHAAVSASGGNPADSPHYKSAFSGVSFHRNTGKFESYISIAGKKKYLGSFRDEIDAAQQYDDAVIERGLNRKLNRAGLGTRRDNRHLSGPRTRVQQREVAARNSKRTHYKGVQWCGGVVVEPLHPHRERSESWRTSLSVDGKTYVLGVYASDSEAARAYDNFILVNGLQRKTNLQPATAKAWSLCVRVDGDALVYVSQADRNRGFQVINETNLVVPKKRKSGHIRLVRCQQCEGCKRVDCAKCKYVLIHTTFLLLFHRVIIIMILLFHRVGNGIFS